jgi:hypothetical protein
MREESGHITTRDLLEFSSEPGSPFDPVGLPLGIRRAAHDPALGRKHRDEGGTWNLLLKKSFLAQPWRSNRPAHDLPIVTVIRES